MAIADFKKAFHIMTRTETADGEGGRTSSWTTGAAVSIAAYNNQSLEALKAAKLGVTSLWTMIFDNTETGIAYNTYLKRDSDSAYFRVTSEPADYETPTVTSLDQRKVTAERIGGLPT
jgi:hypothetical protein